MATTSPHTPDLAKQSVASPNGGTPIDWLIMVVPTALAMVTFRSTLALVALGLLTAVAFLRKTNVTRSIRPGPFVSLVAAAVIVLSRSEHLLTLALFSILALLVARLVTTVDARVIIASLIDGAGVYLAVNVIAYMAGIRSPGAQDRIGGYIETSGLVRTIFPLAGALEVTPSIAAVYIGAAVFLLREEGWTRRFYRLAFFLAAFVVLTEAGARTAIFAAIALPILVMLLPFVTRWLAPAMAGFASVAPFILPAVMAALQSIAIPVIAYIAPGRDVQSGQDITTLMGRQSIWSNSIAYWLDHVDGTSERLLGFGQNGQYLSGASLTYSDLLIGTVRHPEQASLHNSFLQQLFDGGIVGWLLLTVGIIWASVRLSRNRRRWGSEGVAAIVALVALLVNSLTQISIAPGGAQVSFWILVFLVGVACQSTNVKAPPAAGRVTSPSEDKNSAAATAEHRTSVGPGNAGKGLAEETPAPAD
jgi:hypothetical protein